MQVFSNVCCVHGMYSLLRFVYLNARRNSLFEYYYIFLCISIGFRTFVLILEIILGFIPLLYIHMTNGNLTVFLGIVRELGHLFVIRFIKVGNANFETFCNGF